MGNRYRGRCFHIVQTKKIRSPENGFIKAFLCVFDRAGSIKMKKVYKKTLK